MPEKTVLEKGKLYTGENLPMTKSQRAIEAGAKFMKWFGGVNTALLAGTGLAGYSAAKALRDVGEPGLARFNVATMYATGASAVVMGSMAVGASIIEKLNRSSAREAVQREQARLDVERDHLQAMQILGALGIEKRGEESRFIIPSGIEDQLGDDISFMHSSTILPTLETQKPEA